MKFIQVQKPGPPGVMQLLDVPVPEPKPGEVLIRAHAIGVGMPDCLIRAGTYSWMPPLPATPGTELAGIIEKVGAGVTSRRVGQRVYTTARERPHRGGHYADYVATPAEATFVLPITSRSTPRRRSPIIRSPITSSTMRWRRAKARPC